MQPKNKITAAFLAFFTGFLGGHKLYLGETGGFIGMLILLIISFRVNFPIVLIAAIMQGVKLLNMPEQEFNRKYNRGFVPTRNGPLEARRNAQMTEFEQLPDQAQSRRTIRKPSPQTNFRANPYKNSGIKKYKDFDLQEAIVDFAKGIEISPNDVALHFNIACAYSLTEKKGLAYHHLSQAVLLGLKDVEKIMSHDDLAYVRIQPEFEAFKSCGFRVNPFKSEVTPSNQASQNGNSNGPMDDTLLSQLNTLSELRKRGVLSENEFNFERKKLLRQ